MRPDNFLPENTTVWSFPNRGNWSTHSGEYRGNWSPYVPRNLLLRYSKPKDWILDQFLGGGTTLIEAKLLQRNAIGIDINPSAIKITNKKLQGINSTAKIHLRQGDARHLNFIKTEKIDFICTHPPYADIIRYSIANKNDLSLCVYANFLKQLKLVARECFRVLKKHHFCAFMIGDIRKHGDVLPLGFESLQCFLLQGFHLKEIIIKEQHNCHSTLKWQNKNKDFLLLAHEYIFVLRK